VEVDPMANRPLEENTLNLLTTEYGAYTAFGGVPPPVSGDAEVAGKARAERNVCDVCDADVMFRAVCARLVHLVEHGVAAQTQAGVLECVAALEQLREHVIADRARHPQCK
jgi:hypothetical protein